MVVRWNPITKEIGCPPMGDELKRHIKEYKSNVSLSASCSAWWLLYRTILDIGEQPGEVVFGKYGKPYFRNKNIYFSISHSKDICAIVISEIPVGIDIECCERKYNRRLYEKTLTESEKHYYKDDFIRAWCRKESVMKLTGEGLVGYPLHLDTVNDDFNYVEKIIQYGQHQYRITVATK